MTHPTTVPIPSPNELLKAGSPTLSGTIAQTLADAQADHFAEDDTQFLKSHGVYQQDDRDLRKTGKKYIFMVRCRIPGGVLTPAQYLACDDLSVALRQQHAPRDLPARFPVSRRGQGGLARAGQGDQ